MENSKKTKALQYDYLRKAAQNRAKQLKQPKNINYDFDKSMSPTHVIPTEIRVGLPQSNKYSNLVRNFEEFKHELLNNNNF